MMVVTFETTWSCRTFTPRGLNYPYELISTKLFCSSGTVVMCSYFAPDIFADVRDNEYPHHKIRIINPTLNYYDEMLNANIWLRQ